MQGEGHWLAIPFAQLYRKESRAARESSGPTTRLVAYLDTQGKIRWNVLYLLTCTWSSYNIKTSWPGVSLTGTPRSCVRPSRLCASFLMAPLLYLESAVGRRMLPQVARGPYFSILRLFPGLTADLVGSEVAAVKLVLEFKCLQSCQEYAWHDCTVTMG